MKEPQKVAVIIDYGSGASDAIYLDGHFLIRDPTLLAVNVFEACGGQPSVVEFHAVELPYGREWPETLDEALKYVAAEEAEHGQI